MCTYILLHNDMTKNIVYLALSGNRLFCHNIYRRIFITYLLLHKADITIQIVHAVIVLNVHGYIQYRTKYAQIGRLSA